MIQDEILQIGTVESWRSSRVATEVSGRVEVLQVRRGAKVKKGDLLARLSASTLRLKLKESEAKQNAAMARLQKSRDNLKRSESLMKEGLIAERVYRDAKLTVEELEQTLAVNESERLQTQDELNKKEVRAPFDGIVTQALTEEGEWVTEGGGIVHLVDLSRVRILVEMPEKYIREVQMGGAVFVQIDAVPGEVFSGKVHALIPAGDRAARLFPVEVHVENKGLLLQEGMLARVAFALGASRRVLMVDKDALIRKGSEAFLFVVTDAKAVKKTVMVGQGKADLIEVNGEIKVDDLVVIRGNERLREGRAVHIVSDGVGPADTTHPASDSESPGHAH
ncbi:MAG: efflux RND transporter periplasmic adaptor subunit [Nitrospirae bacterium]|nr:efflux RND transporter periplasmic adaptor subunit [Candidatus Manganitrophaceae bacterium]